MRLWALKFMPTEQAKNKTVIQSDKYTRSTTVDGALSDGCVLDELGCMVVACSIDRWDAMEFIHSATASA